MTDVGEFIDDYLQHIYNSIKAREYYLRTRELKGRAVKKVKQLADNAWETDKEFDVKVREQGRERQKAQAQAQAQAVAKATREERLVMQKRRIEQARNRTNKVKDPIKRRGLLDKIRNIEKKVDNVEKNIPRTAKKKAGAIADKVWVSNKEFDEKQARRSPQQVAKDDARNEKIYDAIGLTKSVKTYESELRRRKRLANGSSIQRFEGKLDDVEVDLTRKLLGLPPRKKY